jgi:protein-disulfide isomerase
MAPLSRNLSVPGSMLLLLVVSTSCARGAEGKPLRENDVIVAVADGVRITARELEEFMAEPLQDLRKRSVDRMVNDRLLTLEASRRGLSLEALTKAEIDDRVTRPTEAVLRQMFTSDQRDGKAPPGATFEQVRDQVEAAAMRTRKVERGHDFVEQLRSQANVQVHLPLIPRARVAVEATGPAEGPEAAPVTLVEFADFECPYSARLQQVIEAVMKRYDGRVRHVFRRFPLAIHDHAQKAAQASFCAEEQGRFWQYRTGVFAHQASLEDGDLRSLAAGLGLDAARFADCLDSGRTQTRVDADLAAGARAAVTSTPTLFINGMVVHGARTLGELQELIDAELSIADKPR